MATKTFKGRIQNKHDTEANWNAAVNFKPLAGELIIYDEDNAHSTPRFKVGDGSTLVSDLPFVNGSMKFGADSFSYEDSVGNIGTFGPMSIELDDSTYKAVYDTTSIGYKNISTDVAYDLNFPAKSGTFAVTSDIDVTAAGNNTFTGSNWFMGSGLLTTKNGIRIGFSDGVSPDTNSSIYSIDKNGFYGLGKNNSPQTIKFPDLSTFFTATHTIPLSDTDNIFTGKILINTDPVNLGGSNRYKTIDFSNYDSIKVGWKQSNTLDSNWYNYTRYADGAIYRSLTGVDEVSYILPINGGTLALTSDIDVTAAGDNIFTGTNTFKTETSDNLFRTLIDQNGISVGGGPAASGILIDVTYGLDNIKRLYGGNTYTYSFPNKNGIFATMNDIPNVASLAKLAQDNTFTGTNTFNNGGFKVNGSYGTEALSIDPLNSSGTGHTGMTTLKSAIDQYCSIELGAGSLSISSKGTNNNTGHINISTGANGVDFNIAGVTSAFKVLSDGIKVNSIYSTKYCGGKIENIVSSTTYSLTLPSKSGTLALTNDIPIKTATLSGTTLSITLS